jgi:hypothetical protein
MFSGGDYEEVARWLRLFATSHAKRESPRVETLVEQDDERRTTYRVRVTCDGRSSAALELDATEVAASRGSRDWCGRLAIRIRGLARALLDPARCREPIRVPGDSSDGATGAVGLTGREPRC